VFIPQNLGQAIGDYNNVYFGFRRPAQSLAQMNQAVVSNSLDLAKKLLVRWLTQANETAEVQYSGGEIAVCSQFIKQIRVRRFVTQWHLVARFVFLLKELTIRDSDNTMPLGL